MTELVTAVELTAEGFAPFGDVIEVQGEPTSIINRGRCGRYHDLAQLEFDETGGPGISLFQSQAIILPLQLDMLERHPLGNQAFIPMSGGHYLVVVGVDCGGRPAGLQAFVARPDQGVNYHRNIWHAVLMPIGREALFAVVDWIGPRQNLEEFHFKEAITIRTEVV